MTKNIDLELQNAYVQYLACLRKKSVMGMEHWLSVLDLLSDEKNQNNLMKNGNTNKINNLQTKENQNKP